MLRTAPPLVLILMPTMSLGDTNWLQASLRELRRVRASMDLLKVSGMRSLTTWKRRTRSGFSLTTTRDLGGGLGVLGSASVRTSAAGRGSSRRSSGRRLRGLSISWRQVSGCHELGGGQGGSWKNQGKVSPE
ncbi:MAG: hypothetical protein HC904_01460 [Blastochloris sp.]|nr:hypothetical protein [Blastochloris sp.]